MFYDAQGAASSQEACLRFDTAKFLRGWQIPSETLLGPFWKLQAFLGGAANERSPASNTRERLCVPAEQ